MAVGGPADNLVDLCSEDNTDAQCQCLGKGQTRLPGSRTRSLVSCAQRLHVITVGLSRDGFTRKGGMSSIRN
jgi:hypothetical protein